MLNSCQILNFQQLRRLGSIASFVLAIAGGLCACVAPGNPATNLATANRNLDAIVSRVAAKDPGSTLPANWHKGAFLEIFVRGFKDSDGDGIGDLRGVTQSLDYLRDLGIKGIWLMPITQSLDGDHGYAVTDYRSIETAYGSMADFDELLKQAHARGIGVIMDYVINHSASTHPLFLNAMSSPASPYRSWYLWENAAPTGWDIYGKNPWHTTKTGAYFAAFDISMPDFNLRNRDAINFHLENMRFWLNRGIDGFRFDAVGHLVENGPKAWDNQKENYVLMNEVRALVASYERRYMVCESPSDPAGFAAPNACGSGFAFTHHENVMKTAKGDADAMKKISDYFKTAQPDMATMLANHDQFAGDRIWDQVKGNAAQYRVAAATYLLQPGTPFIYYGEEIGMAGAANLNGDPKLRTPMSWNADAKNAGFSSAKPFRALSGNYATHNVASQMNDPDSLLTFYKAMIKLRNTLPSISQGSYDASFISGNVMGFTRKFGGEQTLVMINYGAASTNVNVNGLTASASIDALFPANTAKLKSSATGSAEISIAPHAVMVFSSKQ
jgi:alpha-amylase